MAPRSLSRVVAFVWITRPWFALVFLPTFLAGVILGGGNFPSFPILTLGILGFLFGKAGASAANDFFDYQIDAKSHPDRPIPRGVISRIEALWFATILFGLFMTIGLILALELSAPQIFAVYSLSTLVVFFHFWKGKRSRIPILSTVGTTSLPGFVALGGFVQGKGIDEVAVILFTMMWAWDFAHDSCSSIRDVEGDREFGVQTPAVAFGTQGALLLSLMGFGVSIFLAIILRSLVHLGLVFTTILFLATIYTLGSYALFCKRRDPHQLYASLSWFQVALSGGIILDMLAKSV